MHALTAAHRTLPFGTCVRVTNPAMGVTSWCGSPIAAPTCAGGCCVSYAAAQRPGLLSSVARVRPESRLDGT
jgi:hypothetical protein